MTLNSSTKLVKLTDTLSRAHSEETDKGIPEELIAQVYMVCTNSCATDEKLLEIQSLTLQDDVLNQIAEFAIQRWPATKIYVSDQIRSYWLYKEEISVISGLFYKGERIIIPSLMRKDILTKPHQSHMGIEKIKLRAREKVFWPGINRHMFRESE